MKSFNPTSEQRDDWPCKFDLSPEVNGSRVTISPSFNYACGIPGTSGAGEGNFVSPCGHSTPDDDDEVTETKIRAFLDEKVMTVLH